MAPLISVYQLAELLDATGRERPVVLDVRWRLGGPPGIQDYLKGHLPGAVFVDVDDDLAAPAGTAGRHPLPQPPAFERVMRNAGIRADSTVIAYDDRDGTTAARAWWLLRWAGLPADQVMVLDGGFAAWSDAGLPVSAGRFEATVPAQAVPAREVTAQADRMPVLDADQAARLAVEGVLLDARAPARYRGDVEPVDPVAGHVPGARNAPASGHVGPDGRWLSPAELAARFAALGVNPTAEVGAYCGSGVTAAAVVLALEYSGLRSPSNPAALYAGSWSQWCADPDRQVATGA